MLPQGEVSKNVPLCLEAISMLQKVFIKFVEEVWRLTETSHEPRQRWRTKPFSLAWQWNIPARCSARLSSWATTASLGLIECVAPRGTEIW